MWQTITIPANGDQTMKAHAFEFDTLRNLLWVGTLRGLKVLNLTTDVSEKNVSLTGGIQLVATYRGIKVYIPEEGHGELTIYNGAGRKIMKSRIPGMGWHSINLSQNLPSGIYIAKFRMGNQEASGKFVKIK